MVPDKVFCHNPNCHARGKLGLKNIGVHSSKQSRYICHNCGKTFTDTKGTMFYRLKHSAEFVALIITLHASSCHLKLFELTDINLYDKVEALLRK